MVSTFKEKCFWCIDTIELIPLFAKQDKHTEGLTVKGFYLLLYSIALRTLLLFTHDTDRPINQTPESVELDC